METAFRRSAAMPKPDAAQECLVWPGSGCTPLLDYHGPRGAPHRLRRRVDATRCGWRGHVLSENVAYPFILDLEQVLVANPPETFGRYRPPAKTGWSG